MGFNSGFKGLSKPKDFVCSTGVFNSLYTRVMYTKCFILFNYKKR